MLVSLRKKYLDHIEGISSIIKLDRNKSEEEANLIVLSISGILNGLVSRNFIYDNKIEIERIKMFAKDKIQLLVK